MSSNAKNAAGKPVSIVWLRRDLRLYDHKAFAAAANAKLPVQPVFVFDTDVLARFKTPQDRRLTLIAEALCRMHGQLRKKSGGVIVLHGRAEAVIPLLCDALHAAHLFAAEDYEPATRARDAKVESALKGKIAFTRVRDHLLTHPEGILKSDGTPYKVFTPYSKAWREAARHKPDFLTEADMKGVACADYEKSVAGLSGKDFSLIDPENGVDAMLGVLGYQRQVHDWPVGEARKRLHDFTESGMQSYTTARNFMAEGGTSRLSPYLRFGLLSIRECARLAFEEEARSSAGASTWINELIWRDFYAMILYHFPNTATEEMQPQTRDIKWSYDKALFKCFAEGRTGYPIVDAAMRELLATGYMHNRARMIVASFMTKDLQLDWRMGEEHFAQYLMDYELSSNVGGWQWAASTGTDAQPYFRVFNPLLQSQKFDPEGAYIRAHVPELADLPSDAIHEPAEELRKGIYPPPVVDHATAKARAIAMFKKASAV